MPDKELIARDYNEIIDSGVLNVVTDYNSIGYFVSGDSVAGFQYEILKALEDDLNVKVNLFLENSLDDNLKGLQSQKYDLIARNIAVNSELRELYYFTEPLTLNKLILVQRKAEYNNNTEPVRQHLDLAKKSIYVPEDSPSILRLTNLSHEIGDTIFIIKDSTYGSEQLVMMVASGNIDYTVCDEKTALRLSETLPEIDIETDISFTQIESWVLRKDSPILLDSLNNWLDRIKDSKRFKEIYNRYY
ncbi:MAG: transporter substrate-binding domain-containing protein [Fermentimonas sp.]|jgi:membrane-bound lytic murein transglycosylase MltF|nr:transporter substrate-binding domain-containing protein [Fermentimonas sp.]HBT86860.1 glutamine ABC transporter substrate-binding protein [Porphyromonadaceae bacterium]MDD3188180.1 transporter substrate-binding domain-containing protein [Fermentimonas sp.]MDD3510380.1 transporter substrate-binding domain-containing protein [Fermentimonas sp.]MDD4283982.1 transporter substrate-binding domain-containing protein [Fermentimonas sp.]